MKTPKRKLICPNCGEEIIVKIPESLYSSDPVFRCPSGCTLHDARYFLHGEIPELYKFTRWKRKNREARLRNRIRVDLYHRMMEKYWKDCTMDCLDALTMRKDMDGTFGQDIEGS